jgi:hypothetical protein
MTVLADFLFILANMYLAWLLPTGGYPESHFLPPRACGGPFLMTMEWADLLFASLHTTMHTTASPACFHCLRTRKHARFKRPLPSVLSLTIMPTVSLLNLPAPASKATSGTLSTATLVTSFTFSSGAPPPSEDPPHGNDDAFLSPLQATPIHAPPGPRPLRTGVRATTKMQLQTDHKATKEAKVKATKEKKLAATARRAEKQEHTIQAAKARAAKAVAKANALRHKLEGTISAPPAIPGVNKG